MFDETERSLVTSKRSLHRHEFPTASLPFPRAAERPVVNPWIIGVTVTLATFMELRDTAIANDSLPHIAGGLAVSYDEGTWVLTNYRER